MANSNSNYIYGVPPTQGYQEYGVYGESIDTATVPLEYVGSTYSILYTGVTSYEFNGTTYYNYNLYDIPVFNSSHYDSISSDLRSNYVLFNTSQSSSTSISYNSSSNNSYTVENHGLFTETSSLVENDSTNAENISRPSTQVENHTDIKHEDSNSEILIESHIETPAFTTQAVVNNSIEYNVLEQDNTVSETDIDEDCEEYLLIYEDSKIWNRSVQIEDPDMKESDKVIYEKSKIADWSVEIEDEDMKESEKKIYEESKIADWGVENEDDVIKSEKVLYEECVHQSLFTEETAVLDWTVEVPENDVKTDEDDDFNKANSSTDRGIDLNYSTADIKYLKEKLYIEALSGHLYLKESVPVVDVLPVIEEEYESVEENDSLEWFADDLKDREKNIPDGKEQNIESDVALDTCETFIANRAAESSIVFEEMKENYLNLIENGLKTVPICNLSQQNLSNHEGSKIKSDQRYFNDDNIQMNETKYFSLKKESTIETSSKESELFVENVSQLVETDHVFNAASQEHQFGKENREPWCCNDEALLKSDEEFVKVNEEISNQTDRNLIMNATGHDCLDTLPDGEYYSKEKGVKIMKNGENASRKRSKKKFNGFRKWFSNVFCCVRKKKSSDSFD